MIFQKQCKKLTAIILTATIIFAFAGCGSQNSQIDDTSKMPGNSVDSSSAQLSDNNNEDKSQEETVEQKNKDVIQFKESNVIYKDTIVQIELLNFYTYHDTDENGENFDIQYFTIKVKNLTNNELVFNTEAYLQDEQLSQTFESNSGPEPQKSSIYKYGLWKNNGLYGIPINSINDLFKVEVLFYISILDESNTMTDQYTASATFNSMENNIKK